jgi:hypothetical protein
MIRLRSLHKAVSVLALVFMTSVLQGCPLTVKLVDDCKTDGGGTTGEGYCLSHRFGTRTGDAQNFPACTGGYVCNSPGVTCVDASGHSGHCTLNPNSGTCDCKCM